jgi:zinc finger RNA-binding protein
LPNGTGLRDPCEKEPTDLAENLKNQQREELTASAQMALRLLAFKQIYKILGMDKLEFVSNATNNRMPKKRQHTSEDNETNEKKGKKEDETSTGTATTAAAIVPTPMSQTQ